MKISFFIGSMGSGGAERVISILANFYAKKDWDVDIVVLLNNKVSYELDKRIRIVDLSNRGSYIKNAIKWLASIRKYVKSTQPDRIVSFIGRINVMVLTATLGLNIPVIVSERNDPKHDGRGKIMEIYSNYIYKFADSIIFQTEYEKSCFNKKLYKNSYIIPNPINVLSTPKKEEKFEIVTAGRLTPQKNHKLLIDAFALLSEKYEKLQLKIYGGGGLRTELQNQIDTYGRSDVIKLCGNVSDLHERISSATLFVMTSKFEGLSNALIEAMMLGLPCVSTDYPGVSEIITDGQNGLIVAGDNVDILAKTMEKVILDSDLRDKLSKNAIKKSQEYKKNIVLKKWEKIIEGV